MSFSAGVELIEVLRPIDEWMHQKVEDIVDDFLTPTTQQEKPNLTAFNASEMTMLVFNFPHFLDMFRQRIYQVIGKGS